MRLTPAEPRGGPTPATKHRHPHVGLADPWPLDHPGTADCVKSAYGVASATS
jgi:hypothetical protein